MEEVAARIAAAVLILGALVFLADGGMQAITGNAIFGSGARQSFMGVYGVLVIAVSFMLLFRHHLADFFT